MNAVRKRKIKYFFKKNRKFMLGGGIFLLVGIIGVWLGFEISEDWHAIRNWLSSPYSTTFFICLVVGILAVSLIVIGLINLRKGEDR